MAAAPHKHPFPHRYTLGERWILAWPEAPLPAALPQPFKDQAIRGVTLNGFFEGKEVWFWPRRALPGLLDFIEQHNMQADPQACPWIEMFDLYFDHGGYIDFSANQVCGWSMPGYPNLSDIRSVFLEHEEDDEDDAGSYDTAVYWLHFVVGPSELDVSAATSVSPLEWLVNFVKRLFH